MSPFGNRAAGGEVPQLAPLSMLIVAGAAVLGMLFMRLATRHNRRI